MVCHGPAALRRWSLVRGAGVLPAGTGARGQLPGRGSADYHCGQSELAQVQQRNRRVQSAALYREAQTALAGEEWAAAIEQLQAVLTLEPTHAEAQARLAEGGSSRSWRRGMPRASSTMTLASGRRR